jgi:hypothetical protein
LGASITWEYAACMVSAYRIQNIHRDTTGILNTWNIRHNHGTDKWWDSLVIITWFCHHFHKQLH